MPAEPPSNPAEFFDLKKLRRLAELMNDQDLSELDLQQGETRVRLRRRLELDAPVVEARPRPTSAEPRPASSGATPSAAPDDGATLVKSPMVGTFYVAPSPDAAPFVKVGDHVGPETVVCVIEAMKVFNEIAAECSGKVVARLVENGEPVEFGQPLFKIAPGA
jgi:acetyl-CoA carboxylase biotin carboxyl carrier protein